MNPDDFESQLRSRPWRTAPPAWRREVLSAASAQAEQSRQATRLAPRISRWRDWLWPHPVAWAGLAAIWMVTLSLHVLAPDAAETSSVAATQFPPRTSPAMQMALAEQRKLRDELLGLAGAAEMESQSERPADPADPAEARPRSALPRTRAAVA